MAVRVGTSPESWGIWFPQDSSQIPWSRFLDEVVEAGYDAIELGRFGYLPTEPGRLRMELQSRGIRLTGAFVAGFLERADDWAPIEAELLQMVSLVTALGGAYIGIVQRQYTDPRTTEMIGPRELDAREWGRLIDSVHRIGERARHEGLVALFHPLAECAIEYEHQIDQFLEDTDPQVVGLLLDVGHHAYRGGDPVAYFRAHHDRIGCLHLKSVDEAVRVQVQRERIPWARAVESGVFTEPSLGAVDFKGLKAAIDDTGFDSWAIVEQDMYPAPFGKPLPIAARTRQYLRELGYA